MSLRRVARRDLPRWVAVASAPVLLVQGLRAVARVPRLPEAGGASTGVVAAAAEGAERRLLVTGESTAAGVGVDAHENGIAGALARRLAVETGSPVRWEVAGRNGARLAEGARRGVPAASGEYDLVVVLLGVNDTLGLTSVGHWRAQAARLLDRLTGQLRPGGLVVLAGVPPLHAFPALPQPLRAVAGLHARVLDDALRDLAAERDDVVHVPAPVIQDERDLAVDRFHPSAHGYDRWAEAIHRAAVAPWAQVPRD